MRRLIAILPLLASLTAPSAFAAHTQARLLLNADDAAPGTTVLAGVQLQMEPGWHTYWKNPGEAGEATAIQWQLPAGVTAGEVEWPLPEKIPPLDITTYGYENEVILLVPLTLSSTLPPGPLHISAKVSWLECKESCIPANTTVQAELTIASTNQPSAAQPLLAAWQAKMPVTVTNFSAQAWWEETTNNNSRLLNLEWAGPPAGADFFPDAYDNLDVSGKTESLATPAGQIHLRKLVKKFSGDWPASISGVFASSNGAVIAQVKIGDAPTTAATISATPAQSLWQMLLYAFIGGLILNIMPCVLPVIALKILGFVNEARSEPRRVRLLGLVYASGVVISFLTLAAIIIGVKAAGNQVGWGFQFGNPIFLVCLTILVTLVALNLFGVFEVILGGRAISAAGELASRHGAAGAFFNGVLATALATPCTAPFLGAALGFAFSQPPVIIICIFISAGLGLAAPYVLLSWHPAWLKFLPKPGAWMEKFKIAMGFPMLATVVWLFNVAAADYGDRVFWFGVYLVIVAFAAWIFGEFVQRGRSRKSLAAVLVLILLAGGYVLVLENKLHWREMASPTAAKIPDEQVNWQPWSPAAVTAARAAGKTVLVDFTASWCVTCNAIVKPALESDAVAAALKRPDTVALLADYTRTPPEITAELAKYGSAGVPLVLIFPKTPGAPAIILPQPSPLQLPSGYAKVVLEALDKAAK